MPLQFGAVSAFAPFRVRSFRFQYPADMLTSWGFEMETLILGWYVLVETGSVFLLTLFGSLQYFGTLVAPFLGVLGDRLGHRFMLCVMRSTFTVLAAVLMSCALAGVLRPWVVFVLAGLSGLVRPSDLAMRGALVAATIPANGLMAAMGVSRTTSDSARIAGSLAGAGLFAAVGIGFAYVGITAFYVLGLLLTFGVACDQHREVVRHRSPLHDLREGLSYVLDAPGALAAMLLAFLVNLTAFPLTSGLLPYVAREIYHVDQTGLGTLVASFAAGALAGSIGITLLGALLRPARMMIVFACVWYGMLLVFVRVPDIGAGRFALFLAGLAQSLSLVPMSVMLLRTSDVRFRGVVMGVRMLAIYGLPIGLLCAGVLIEAMGFVLTASAYALAGFAVTCLIAVHWRANVWASDAAANSR